MYNRNENEELCEKAFLDFLQGRDLSDIRSEAVSDGTTLRLSGAFIAPSGPYRGTLEGPENEPGALGAVLAAGMLAKAGIGPAPGKVWLLGAGPGDAGLMSIRGKEVLENADAVVYDALVGDGVLAMIPEKAQQIFAGKRSGHHYLRQEETNRVLLFEAMKGKSVVRLKGGDPFLFGRGGEELELLSFYGVPWEVVPGITSAFAVPAYNGIPVTHRDFCSSVHIVTGHRRADHTLDIDFEALKRTGGTLVFLMGVASLPDICRGLLEAGMDPATPAAVLERGTTAKQHRIMGTLETLPAICAATTVMTPAIIVVGRVVSLAERFAWAESRPLAGVKVIVTKHADRDSSLSGMLRKKGAEVAENTSIHTVLTDEGALEAACGDISCGRYDTVVFCGAVSVQLFMKKLLGKYDIRILGRTRIASWGSGTVKELGKYGLRADFEFSDEPPFTSGNILLIREKGGAKECSEALDNAGCNVTDLEIYETVYEKPRAIDLAGEIASDEIDFAVFTSVSTVRGFAESCRGADLTKVRAVCIGASTAKAAEELGMRVRVSEKATLESLVRELEKAAGELREEKKRMEQTGENI